MILLNFYIRNLIETNFIDLLACNLNSKSDNCIIIGIVIASNVCVNKWTIGVIILKKKISFDCLSLTLTSCTGSDTLFTKRKLIIRVSALICNV